MVCVVDDLCFIEFEFVQVWMLCLLEQEVYQQYWDEGEFDGEYLIDQVEEFVVVVGGIECCCLICEWCFIGQVVCELYDCVYG